MKEEIMEVKKEVQELREQSFAMEILKDYKKANKRLFCIILVVLSMWFITIGYLVYTLNDIGTQTNTIDIEEVEQIDNSHIKIGDTIYELGEEKWEE